MSTADLKADGQTGRSEERYERRFIAKSPSEKRDKDNPSFLKKQTPATFLRKILNFVKFEPASTFPIYHCARPLTRALTMEARSII
jgi:hypothetical protein